MKFYEYPAPSIVVGTEKIVLNQSGITKSSTLNNIINDLGIMINVELTNPQNGDVLIYNNSTSHWENGTISGGVEVFVDFSIAPTQFNEIITFNNEHGVWENSPFNFELIWDVQFDQGQLSEGQPLIYNANGNFWTNYVDGYTGSFKDADGADVIVSNGLIVAVERWWDSADNYSGLYGTHYVAGSGWTFEDAS